MAWKDFNKGDEDKTQVSWNISASQSQHIFELMRKATNFYLKGNLGQWYWTLSALRENVNFNLKDGDRNTLDDMEKECSIYLIQWETYLKNISEGKQTDGLKKSKELFSGSIRKYQRSIFDMLKELGYFPDKEDRTKLSF